MRKNLYAMISLALCGALYLGGCSFVNLGGNPPANESKLEASSEEPAQSEEEEQTSVSTPANSEEEEDVTLVYNAELCEYFSSEANGNTLYVNTKATVKTNGDNAGTVVGKANAGEIVIDGEWTNAILTATGEGVGAIQAAEGSVLVFKNLTIKDSSAALTTTTDRREGYLEFGGKLRFENCKFACAAYLCDDADAEFVGCEFDSGAENMYAMWISDGSATFTNCVFTGWRAIKLYEGSDNHYTSVQAHYDVERIVIDGCTFEDLQKKPGIAIDVFQGKQTSITIKNSEFDGCKEWTKDSYEGLLTVYESDVDTQTLTFAVENVTSDGTLVDWTLDREFGSGTPNA